MAGARQGMVKSISSSAGSRTNWAVGSLIARENELNASVPAGHVRGVWGKVRTWALETRITISSSVPWLARSQVHGVKLDGVCWSAGAGPPKGLST